MDVDELRQNLKDALATIREKERDLLIASQIGQQLVSANASLANDYESLLASTASGKQPPPSTAPSTPDRHSPPEMSSSPGNPAVKATKRASMSISMSRLAMSELSAIATPGETVDVTSPSYSADGTKRTIQKKRSINGIYEYVNGLERANADLTEQLSVVSQNLSDAEMVHTRSINHLRNNNAQLQSQLQSALRDVRDVERQHSAAVKQLEEDLESLRSDFANASLDAHNLDVERRRLLRERVEVLRESESVEKNDMDLIQELKRNVDSLQIESKNLLVAKQSAERRVRALQDELEAALSRVSELEERVGAADAVSEECDRRGKEIEELKYQLEEARMSSERHREEGAFAEATKGRRRRTIGGGSGSVQGDQLAVVLRGAGVAGPGVDEDEFEFTPWLNRIRNKTWERDVEGLKEEIAYLRDNRVAAYSRLRHEMDAMVSSLVSVLPTSIQSLTTRVVGIPSSPPAARSL